MVWIWEPDLQIMQPFSKKYCPWLYLWADQDIHKNMLWLECQYSQKHHNFWSWWNGLKYCVTKWTTSRMEHDFFHKTKRFCNSSSKTIYTFSKLLNWKTFSLIVGVVSMYAMYVGMYVYVYYGGMYVCRFASDTNISESSLRIFF